MLQVAWRVLARAPCMPHVPGPRPSFPAHTPHFPSRALLQWLALTYTYPSWHPTSNEPCYCDTARSATPFVRPWLAHVQALSAPAAPCRALCALCTERNLPPCPTLCHVQEMTMTYENGVMMMSADATAGGAATAVDHRSSLRERAGGAAQARAAQAAQAVQAAAAPAPAGPSHPLAAKEAAAAPYAAPAATEAASVTGAAAPAPLRLHVRLHLRQAPATQACQVRLRRRPRTRQPRPTRPRPLHLHLRLHLRQAPATQACQVRPRRRPRTRQPRLTRLRRPRRQQACPTRPRPQPLHLHQNPRLQLRQATATRWRPWLG